MLKNRKDVLHTILLASPPLDVRLHALKAFLLGLLNYGTFMFEDTFGYKTHRDTVENLYIRLIKNCLGLPKYSNKKEILK